MKLQHPESNPPEPSPETPHAPTTDENLKRPARSLPPATDKPRNRHGIVDFLSTAKYDALYPPFRHFSALPPFFPLSPPFPTFSPLFPPFPPFSPLILFDWFCGYHCMCLHVHSKTNLRNPNITQAQPSVYVRIQDSQLSGERWSCLIGFVIVPACASASTAKRTFATPTSLRLSHTTVDMWPKLGLWTAYQSARTLCICLIWMGKVVWRGCQPQPWPNGIISAWHVTHNHMPLDSISMCLNTFICLIWMGEAVWGGCQPQAVSLNHYVRHHFGSTCDPEPQNMSYEPSRVGITV